MSFSYVALTLLISHLFVRSFVRSFVRACVRACVRSFVCSFIYGGFNHPCRFLWAINQPFEHWRTNKIKIYHGKQLLGEEAFIFLSDGGHLKVHEKHLGIFQSRPNSLSAQVQSKRKQTAATNITKRFCMVY